MRQASDSFRPISVQSSHGHQLSHTRIYSHLDVCEMPHCSLLRRVGSLQQPPSRTPPEHSRTAFFKRDDERFFLGSSSPVNDELTEGVTQTGGRRSTVLTGVKPCLVPPTPCGAVDSSNTDIVTMTKLQQYTTASLVS